MNNHIINFQNFKKPNNEFIKDKECLICLEEFDIETNQFIMLPCKCSNSVYHIDCIVKFLQSGQKKNFCPHCKGKYEIQLEEQIQHLIPINTNPQNQDIIRSKFTHILVVHILSNSIMNVINIVVARKRNDYNNPEELQLLMLFYFVKIFFSVKVPVVVT